MLIKLLLKHRTHRCTVLRSLESVNFSSSGDKRALGDTVCAIHLVGTQLPHSMPVDSGSIVLQVARDCYFNFITPVGFNSLILVSKFPQNVDLHVLVQDTGR